jgi:hypothetical protein
VAIDVLFIQTNTKNRRHHACGADSLTNQDLIVTGDADKEIQATKGAICVSFRNNQPK